MKTTHLSFAVAVAPRGAKGEVRVVYVLKFRLAPPKGRQSLSIGDTTCTRL